MMGSAMVPFQLLASISPLPHLQYIPNIAMHRAHAREVWVSLTGTAGVERPHVEDVNPLHFTQNLNTLETSGLLEIGGDGTGLGSLGEEVVLILDLCN